jgi:hypothetical protein
LFFERETKKLPLDDSNEHVHCTTIPKNMNQQKELDSQKKSIWMSQCLVWNRLLLGHSVSLFYPCIVNTVIANLGTFRDFPAM